MKKQLFTIQHVHECPYTIVGTGVLHLSHDVIATFAGAVYDRNEWMALLIGTRSENGLDITITSLRVPEQTRNSVNCELVNKEPLEDDVVGVVHSHHSMPARFSNTDDTELNPRFPASIVVAQVTNSSNEVAHLLGFEYQAEGRAALPCSSMAIIPFTVLPNPVVTLWPEQPIAGYAAPDDKTLLHYCPNHTRTLEGMQQKCVAKCGVETIEKASVIFGRDGGAFMKQVESHTKPMKQNIYEWGGNQGINSNQQTSLVVNDKRGRTGHYKHDD